MNQSPSPAAGHALDVLEFPALLALVAGYAGAEAGAARIRALRPVATPAEAVNAHPLLAEIMALTAAGEPPPQPPLPDLEEILLRTAPEGACLPGDELLPVRRHLEMAAATAGYLRRHPNASEVHAQLAGFEPLPELGRRLHETLDDNGEVLDHASPALASLRRTLRVQEQRLQRQLEDLAARWHADGLLLDQYVTMRNGRHVIPVRRDAKNRPPGVVHDHSDSGRTLFLEPASTLPAGNELADLRLEERDEVRRILAALAAAIREAAPALRHGHGLLAGLDAATATARWAEDSGCVLPVFGPALTLCGARHPLLARRFRDQGRADALVPLELRLPADARVLLISGPNSGGKTAALKTAGLLTLAAQAGLPVPVRPDSVFRWFSAVLADIGDEQSLARDLSTFTGHLRRIGGILDAAAAAAPALVLLDEAGTGTDPLEGGALACAVLETLAATGALTLATTHLGLLKTFVHDRPGMINAAVRFNPETLAPEFSLDVGQPGSSRALAIAARAGFPELVLDRARNLLSSDSLRLEQMLATIEESRRELERRDSESRAAAAGLQSERRQLHEELGTLRRERRTLLHDAYRQAEAIVAHTRRDMEQLIKQLAEAESAATRKAQAAPVREAVRDRQRRVEDGLASTVPKPARPLPATALKPGTAVWVEKLRARGRILAVSDDRKIVQVEVGGARFTLAASALGRPAPGSEADEVRPAPLAESRPRAHEAVAAEIILIGLRVEEALDRLERHLDRAALAGLPELRIVHGFGTGRLQEAVHQHLRGHPQILRFRLGRAGVDPGGAGITLAELRRG